MGLKTKLVMALATSAAGAAMIAGGTFAEFSSSAATQTNTFSAGTLQLALSPDGGTNWGNHDANVGATWVSPTNWAPGQDMTGTIKLTDEGSIGAKHVYFTFANVTDSKQLLSQIYVTSISENFNGHAVTTDPATIASQIGVASGQPLTLQEFVSHEYYTFDPGSDNGGYVLQPGNKQDYSLTLGLKFNDDGSTDQNVYQGATASFDMNLEATQNSPTEGYVALPQ
jgi:spore coat-associated protein N